LEDLIDQDQLGDHTAISDQQADDG
jgi:hypothetical protein